MAEDQDKPADAAEDAVRAALESVERLEISEPPTPVDDASDSSADDGASEEPAADEKPLAQLSNTGEYDDLDVDGITILKAGDGPPSSDPDAVSGAPALDEIEEDEGDDEGVDFIDADAAPEPKKASPQDAMLQAMIAAKNEAVEVLAQTQKEAQTFRDRLVRAQADFENFKKRANREKEDAIKFANERLLKELMPVLDNLERAIAAGNTDEIGDAGRTVIDGVQMVYKQFGDMLGKFNIEVFSALGLKFDPAKMEAVAQREDKSVPNQTVIEEYQKGFTLAGRLVRPAMVIVSTGGPAAAAKPDLHDASAEEGGESTGDDEGRETSAAETSEETPGGAANAASETAAEDEAVVDDKPEAEQ